MKVGKDGGENEAEGYPRQRCLHWDEPGFNVHYGEQHEVRDEEQLHAEYDGRDAPPVRVRIPEQRMVQREELPGRHDEQEADEQFHQQIAEGDGLAAVAAAAQQQQVTEDRQVVVPRQLVLALGAERTRARDRRDIPRQAIGCHVHVTADDRAQQTADHDPEFSRHENHLASLKMQNAKCKIGWSHFHF
ncbi:MAG: hypothetical protein NTW87_27170 [Planctomycetota bacterium]|nr:hypothetical protein [Planctomycetota bacterium]